VVTAALEAGSADEARLRDERYAKLAQIATAVGASRVFTAHHAEDQTETVLLALFRGAGPGGLCGMPVRRALAPGLELARPLLEVSPQTLRSYCYARHVPFAIDPTNVERTYRRNAVRAALAPLRADFPNLDTAVARCAAILREERAGDPAALLRRQLREELSAFDGDARDLTFERLDAAARAVLRGARGRHFLRRGVEVVVGD
jgi:tRNA(Ile)-lysidine synthase TilS/MesJ